MNNYLLRVFISKGLTPDNAKLAVLLFRGDEEETIESIVQKFI